MPTPNLSLRFSEFALTNPENVTQLELRETEVRASIQPETILEEILASELIHAGWEMERVRQLAHHRDAESRLATANARASRNWHRARKFLKKIQHAQASQICAGLSAEAQVRADSCPLADLSKLPQPFSLEPKSEKEVQ